MSADLPERPEYRIAVADYSLLVDCPVCRVAAGDPCDAPRKTNGRNHVRRQDRARIMGAHAMNITEAEVQDWLNRRADR